MPEAGRRHLLELIEALLPASIDFNLNLDTSEDVLFSSFEVDAQLDKIAVFNGEWFGLVARGAESDVVEKGARGALNISDVPLIGKEEFAMSSADDFGFEADWSVGWIARFGLGGVIFLGISTDTNDGRGARQGSRYFGEDQWRPTANRWPGGRNEVDGRHVPIA